VSSAVSIRFPFVLRLATGETCYKFLMNSSPQASPGIIAIGASAIICGVLGSLTSILVLFILSSAHYSPAGPPIPLALRPVIFGFFALCLVCGIFESIAGVQLIRLRNWARVSLLAFGGCLLFFGVVGIGVIFFVIFGGAPPDPVVSRALLATILTVIYAIPLLLGTWWLFWLTRRSVVAQFHANTFLNAARDTHHRSWLNNPACPLAVRIVGWYLASFILFLPLIPFFPGRFPVLFFGHALYGPAASALLLCNFVVLSLPGIGLLLLKKWSYPLTIASQLFVLINGAAITFSSTFAQVLRSVLSQMNLPNPPISIDQIVHYVRYGTILGLLIPVAIVITLYLSRSRFFTAVDEQSNARPPLPPAAN
jgi:hypothetical protein